MKYLLHLTYNGTLYSGWQRQKNTPETIQEVLESKLSLLSREKIGLLGCGRTDRGVHAHQYFAHCSSSSDLPSLLFKLNRLLPRDISVHHIIEVNEKFHARYGALWRTYRYNFHLKPNPFIKEYSSYYPELERLENHFNIIQELFQGMKDFGGFCKTPDKVENTLCNIKEISLYANADKSQYSIEITGNRFLRGMVRILVENMIALTQNKTNTAELEVKFASGKSLEAVKFAYPQGLSLYRVQYHEHYFNPDKVFDQFLYSDFKKIQ